MNEPANSQSVDIVLLDRTFTLRVRDGEAAEVTQRVAAEVQARIDQFMDAHPRQPELTAALFAALGLAEELYDERRGHQHTRDVTDQEATRLAEALEQALR
ncbi:MAG: cell division protein ZapA [Bacteroidota bacterium]